MKIEKLNPDTIKIFVSDTELTCMDIELDNLMVSPGGTNAFLMYIMEVVKNETEFDPYSGKINVEASPAPFGFNVIISRLKTKKRKLTDADKERYRRARPVIKKKKKVTALYFFKSIKTLLTALEQVSEGLLLKSAVYRYDEGGYILYAPKTEEMLQHHFRLTEFADKCRLMSKTAYVREHAKLIAEKEELLKFVNNMKTYE